ncbi:MAG: NADP-dependent isocitrate dehydrogenase [Pelovirga sp.]
MAAKIIWSEIDEAPALATYAFLPVVQAFTKGCEIEVEKKDISLSGRVLATFPERLTEEQRVTDHLSVLGDLVKTPEANVIKLPNISASIPQLQACIRELQQQGYDIPNYPEEAKNDEEREIQERYFKVLGSAVNPVLREGNSDRRAAQSVKKFAQKNPHKMMQPWPAPGKSQCRVAHMDGGDFYASEKSVTMDAADTVKIQFVDDSGNSKVMKEVKLQPGEVFDSSTMNVNKLREFYAATAAEAKDKGVLLSLHLKATMMRISDPILFGHCVSVYFKDALEKHAATLKEIGASPNYGMGDILEKLEKLPADKKAEIEADISKCYETGPALAMVDSRKNITNLHVPNDVIVDASMPNVVRDGGKMWNLQDELQDTIAMVPDRCYATMYAEIVDNARDNGQFDPATMGSVSNVGLMAQKAEEYGSHDKTFEAPSNGTFQVVNSAGEVLMEQKVEKGDVYRSSQTKDVAIKDWVRLAVERSRESGEPVIFWLDENRGHDRQIIAKLNKYLPEHDTSGLEIKVMPPREAMRYSLERIRKGQNTISATGNVLRDYLTDLFPILELGTSARMLSIVPLLAGGGLFETGAGGSAPKHVQQFLKEGHTRWDSLGEYCALVPSLELVAKNYSNSKAKVLAETLDAAIGTYLENQKLPSRKVKELDNRGSTFYLALYWAQALAAQDQDQELKARFVPVARELTENADKIDKELIDCQGEPQDIGGYFRPDPVKAERAMRPSVTLNTIIEAM